MKKLFISLFLLIALFSLSGKANAEKWYERWLNDNGILVAEFGLKGGETKEVSINADERMWLRFFTKETISGYDDVENPIMIEPKYGEYPWASCSSGNGAGTVFEPIDGKIEVVIVNNTPDTFNVIVETEPYED
jgi:hypothetical protein